MMRVAESPAFLEGIANTPGIFEAVSCKGQTHIDFAPAWASCIGLEFESGGWLVQRLDAGLWECHTLFMPGATDVRGKARIALQHVFCATDCVELVTKVPRDIPKALALAKAVGFSFRFERKDAWPREAGDIDVEYLSVRVEDWITMSESMRQSGERFHERMVAKGFHVNHPEDLVHDAYAGYVVECGKAGMLWKGVALYNRWAKFAGYVSLELVGDSVKFDNVIASLRDGEINLEMQTCP